VRLASVLSCLGLLAAAWRVWRPPVLAIALLLLPMTLYQLLLPTLDGLTTSLAVLTLSLFWSGVLQREWPPGRSWLLAGCVALLATSRVQLLPLLGLPFYIAWAHGSRRDALAGTATMLVSLAWVGYALANTVDLRVQREHGTVELLLQYAADPMSFLRVIGQSLSDPELGPFYAHSFIGMLGWLDTYLPLPAYVPLWTGLGLFALASVLGARLRQAWPARLLLALAAVACVLLVFLALLVTWTAHPTQLVAGVQGRYFILPAFILAYAIGAAPPHSRLGWPALILLVAFAGVSLDALFDAILARYH
jgi:uncharacterized membrane protein